MRLIIGDGGDIGRDQRGLSCERRAGSDAGKPPIA
jgi:hypothetical protein